MRARSFYKSLITLFTHRIRAIDSFVHQDNRYSTTLRPIGSSNNSSPLFIRPLGKKERKKRVRVWVMEVGHEEKKKSGLL